VNCIGLIVESGVLERLSLLVNLEFKEAALDGTETPIIMRQIKKPNNTIFRENLFKIKLPTIKLFGQIILHYFIWELYYVRFGTTSLYKMFRKNLLVSIMPH
jgi:hypothetical protein